MKLYNLLSNLTFAVGFVLMFSDSDNLTILALVKLLGFVLICISVSLLFKKQKA